MDDRMRQGAKDKKTRDRSPAGNLAPAEDPLSSVWSVYSYSTTSSHFSRRSFYSGIALVRREAATMGSPLCTYCFAVSLMSQNRFMYISASFGS